MMKDKYKQAMKYTVTQEYPIYYLKLILKMLSDNNIIYNDRRTRSGKDILDVSKIEETKEKISYLFDNMNNMVKVCENFEYERAYRYSYVYKIENFNRSIIDNLIKDKYIVQLTDDDSENDKMNPVISYPTCKTEGEEIILKFSVTLRNKIDIEFDSYKHTILGIINLERNTFEIRQDVVPIRYQSHENFYVQKVKEIKTWICSFLKCELERIDFQAIVKHMKKFKEEEIIITAMQFERDGMLADLDSAKNPKLTLPILDELRNTLYSDPIFDTDDNTIAIRQLLEDFIKDIEENSLLPSARILWKEKEYELTSYHDKIEGQENYFKWSKNLKDKESMDYVTEYFIECERELKKSFDNQ